MARSRMFAPALVVAPIIAASAFTPVRASWVADGVPVCAAQDAQTYPQIIMAGTGGAIVVWQDRRSSTDVQVYAQRIDTYGTRLWATDGVGIATGAWWQQNPKLATDGAFGAIIAWEDDRGSSWDIFAQSISSAGVTRWALNGLSVCSSAGNQVNLQIIADGSGGAIIVWKDSRGADMDIYAQKLNSAGTRQWNSDGVPVCTATGNQYFPQIVSDGSGGAIVSWHDYRGSDADVYVQRVSSGGSVQWTPDGVALCTAAGDQLYTEIVTDGSGGAIATWQDKRTGVWDIYVRRISSGGSAQWTGDGVAVCTVTGGQYVPKVTSDALGGAVIAWYDYRSGSASNSDIYAQKVNSAGTILWTAGGVPLCTYPGLQELPEVASDGVNGAIVVWRDQQSVTYDLYAQRVDAAGAVKWGANGTPISTMAGEQWEPQIASDGLGGAIIAWQDLRSSNYDIYAQRMDRTGYWGYPCPTITEVLDVPNDQGGRVIVEWAASPMDEPPGLNVATYSVFRRRPGSSWDYIGDVQAHYLQHYSLAVPTLADSTGSDPGIHRFYVEASVPFGGSYWYSPVDSGYSVDNLTPHEPSMLTGTQLPNGLELAWQANEEADLSHYAVYRGSSAGFVPTSENRIGSPVEPEYVDGDWRWDSGYCYKVAAVDRHGNESSYASLSAEDITGVETPKSSPVAYLAQNVPNPFNPTTAIEYSIAEPGHISLKIYNAAGQLVRALVDEEQAPRLGGFKATWDGKNNAGADVASGLYFYQLKAPKFSQTKRMVLLR